MIKPINQQTAFLAQKSRPATDATVPNDYGQLP